MKIAIDWDDTLEHAHIQAHIKKLIQMGHELHIVTTRYDEDHKHLYSFWQSLSELQRDDLHKKLYAVAGELNIPIHFTNMAWKAQFLQDKGFDVLIDDDFDEKIGLDGTKIIFIWSKRAKYLKAFIKKIQKI